MSREPSLRIDDPPAGNRPDSVEPRFPFLQKPIDIRSVALTTLVLFAVFYTLYLARDLFLPLILAVLLSFVLSPVVRWLKRLRIPEILGSVLTLCLLFGGVGVGIYRLAAPAADWADEMSYRVSELAWKLRPITEPVQEVQKATKEVEKKISDITKSDEHAAPDPHKPEAQPVKIEKATLGERLLIEAQEFIVGTATMAIFLFLLLASGDSLLRKVVRILPRLKDKRTAVEVVRQMEANISTYLITITLINLTLGAIVGTGIALFGLPNPLLWGVMAALLNYIPYLGALVGITVVALVALLTYDQMIAIWLPVAFYFTANIMEAYIFTPLILGRRLTLNPIFIFIALLLWGWIWGIAGALMAVPILAVTKIVCDHVEPLAFLGELIGDG